MKEFVIYRGQKYHVQTSGRYYQSGRKTDPERLLHRRMWTDAKGPIPEGMEVHHVDENWRHNAVDNFELKTRTNHRRDHMLVHMADPEFRAKAIQALRDNSHLAAEWHASPEGLAWHAQNGKQAWEVRESVPAVCQQCQQAYMTYFPSRSQFCTSACMQRAAKKRYSTIEAECLHCGIPFTHTKYIVRSSCSRKCAAAVRNGHPFKSYLA